MLLSFEELCEHPLLSRLNIPQRVWENPHVFANSVSDEILSLVMVHEAQLLSAIRRLNQEMSQQDKLRCWCMIVFRGGSIDLDILYSVFLELKIDLYQAFIITLQYRRSFSTDYAEKLINQHPGLIEFVKLNHYSLMREAAKTAEINIIRNLFNLADRYHFNRVDMISANDFEVYFNAAANNDYPIIKLLFEREDLIFSYVAFCTQNSKQVVLNFAEEKLREVREGKRNFLKRYQESSFDLSPEHAQLYTKMLRFLVRLNNTKYIDDIQFLLKIPSIRLLIYSEKDRFSEELEDCGLQIKICFEMMDFHQLLIQFTSSLGLCGVDPGGVCLGFSLKWIEAQLLNSSSKFQSRINWLIQYSKTHIKMDVLLSDALSQLEQWDIHAFFQSLIVFQNPINYPGLLDGRLNQEQFDDTSRLIGSDVLIGHQGFFYFSYDNQNL